MKETKISNIKKIKQNIINNQRLMYNKQSLIFEMLNKEVLVII